MVSKVYFLGLIKRFTVFLSISLLIIVAGLLVFLSAPLQYIYSDGDWDGSRYIPTYDTTKWNILLDSHAHTTYSNGKLTPEQVIQWQIAMGFNACVITDGMKGIYADPWGGVEEARRIAREKYDAQIKILIGVEYCTDDLHILIILPPHVENYREEIVYYGMGATEIQIKSVIDKVHELGGICAAAHIVWSNKNLVSPPSRQTFLDWGVDYIEIIDEHTYDTESYDFCVKNNMAMIFGSGFHNPDVHRVYGYSLLKVSEFSEEAIFAEIAAERTEIMSLPGGVPYNFEHQPNWLYPMLRPLIQIGDLIEDYNPSGFNLDLLGTGILLGYLIGGFLIIEGIRAITPKIKYKISSLKSKENIEYKKHEINSQKNNAIE